MITDARNKPDRRSGSSSVRSGIAPVLLALLVVASTFAAPVAPQAPPDENWRTITTRHFRITYPTPLDSLAVRLAGRAERAYALLASSFSVLPHDAIDIVLTDHADFSNGFANVVPSNRITLYARPPADGRSLSYFHDWMELVVTHELVHVLHLDPAGSVGKPLRALLGRYPAAWPFFPGRAVPTWLTEGIATWYESALTGAGRVHGAWQDMVLRTAALEDGVESLAEVSGDSPVWPAGQRPYIYGSEFFDYLLERTGSGGVRQLVDDVAGQIVPYRINAAARAALGVSFSEAWEEWRARVESDARALADSLAGLHPLTTGEPLTRGAREALYPEVSPDGAHLVFTRADARTHTQLRLRMLDEGDERRLARVNGRAAFSWTPGGDIVFSQFERAGRYRIYSDLYRVNPEGRVGRITRGARLAFPDVHPGGAVAVAVQEGGGTNRLVLVELESGEVRPLTEAVPDEHWSFPRWSPDGSRIAASQWRTGGRFDVVVLDSAGVLVTRVTDDRAVDVAPVWTPDGGTLLWSSDRTGISNLFAVSADEQGRMGAVRQITNVLTGAAYPAVDPAGEWIYYSAYHHRGWDIERIPFAPDEWFEPFAPDPRFLPAAESPPVPPPAAAEMESRPYRFFRSLLPTYWMPVYTSPRTILDRPAIGRGFGFATSGRDLVGRHSFWSWGRFLPGKRQMEGRFGYSARALGNPVVTISLGRVYDAAGARVGERASGALDTLLVVDSDRELNVSVDFLHSRYRNVVGLTLNAGHNWVSSELLDKTSLEPSTTFQLRRPARRTGEVGATLSFSTAPRHAMAMSREDGISGFVRGRWMRVLDLPEELAGDPAFDTGFGEWVGRVSLYKSLGGSGFARRVIALRASGGIAQGAGAHGFHFEAGGAAGTAERISGFSLFGGSPLLFPLRGYAPGARHGRRAWSVSAEYRIPLFLIRKGFGAWPVYFDRAAASLFVDAANAWGPEVEENGWLPNPKRAALVSAGMELAVNALPFWTFPVNVRVGVGFPLVRADGDAEQAQGGVRPRFHLRLGSAF